MTVQFTIETVPTGRFVLVPACLDPGATATFNGAKDYASYEQAFADATVHEVACEDCAEFGCRPRGAFDVPATAISMSNVDAQVTLARLNLRADADSDGDIAGVCDGADFHSRVLAALATLTDDTGIRQMIDATPGLARMVHSGEEAGAIESRLRDLHDLGADAARLGRAVQWS